VEGMGHNEQQEAVMSDKFVLVVSDEKDDKHGEISVLDSAHETERLVETLLGAGFDQERIRVLAGSEAEFLTTYRPVVGFIDEANPTTELEPVEAGSGNGRSVSSLFRSARDDTFEPVLSDSEPAS